VGAGTTRFGKYLDRNLRSLTREAVESALQCAGIDKSLASQMSGNQRLKYIACWAITEPQSGSDKAGGKLAGIHEQSRHLTRHAR
jgi:acetyl-CoA acetyltransferase